MFPFSNITTPALDNLGAGYALVRDVVDEAFEIVPRVVLPPANYSYGFFRGYIATSAARPLGAGFNLKSRRLLQRHAQRLSGRTDLAAVALPYRDRGL